MSASLETALRLLQVIELFRNSANKFSTQRVANELGISYDSARRYLIELSASGVIPLTKKGKYWSRLQSPTTH